MVQAILYPNIWDIFMSCMFYDSFFFLIVKVANDLCVVRSSDQFLIFPILSPAASFDTDNVPPFLKQVLHWTSSAPTVSRFCCFFFYLSHRLYLPSICPVYPLRILLIKCLSGPLFCISKLAHQMISSSHDFKCLRYAYDLSLYPQPCLSPDIQTPVDTLNDIAVQMSVGMSNLMSKQILILFPRYLAFYPLFTTALSAKLFARFRMTEALRWIILDSLLLLYRVCNPLTNPVGSSSFKVNPQTTFIAWYSCLNCHHFPPG